MSIQKTQYHSWRIGSLVKGCQLCVKGNKLVLFVTGICSRNCWFCPLSETKKNKDKVWANEWLIDSEKDIISEARLTEAKGASLTGGDPLCRLERSVRYTKLLKKTFGKKFHMHMYVPMELITYDKLKKIYDAGIDEIRLHPDIRSNKLWKKADIVTKFDWDIGVEIPVIPGLKKNYLQLIDYFKDKIRFLNLNELEMSDTNREGMEERGFKTKTSLNYGVKGSEKLAFDLLKYCQKTAPKLRVHYCTTTLKDRVQLANRIKIRARNAKQQFDIVTDQGMLFRGAIYLKELKPSFAYRRKIENLSKRKAASLNHRLKSLMQQLIKQYHIPRSLIAIDKKKLRLLTSAQIAEDLKEDLKEKNLSPAIVEEYPTWDQTEISVEFL